MELQISLIPSPEDSPCKSEGYQSELRILRQTFRADGLEIHDVAAREGNSPLTGAWRVQLCAMLGPILETPIGSWLQARRGRTVRLTLGEIEADVRTVEELANVIKIAKYYQQVVENES